jgi:hypothetical protein
MDHSQKVIFVGNSSSGKSTICRLLLGKKALKKPIPTMGVEVHVYSTPMTTYKLWDCGGLPQYRGLGSGYYHGATMVFVVHGGPHYHSPQTWEEEVKVVAPHVQVYHIYGTLGEKYSKVKSLLA